MDKKKACSILNIDAQASFEEAKKAYRNLAKKYHPDVIENNSCLNVGSDVRMKDINLAFRFLSPILRLKKPVKERKKKKQNEAHTQKKSVKVERNIKETFFLRLNKVFTKVLHGKKSNQKPLNGNEGQRKTKKYAPSQKRAGQKKNISFEEVFGSLHNVSSTRKEKIRKVNFYREYQKYISIQRRVKSSSLSRNNKMNIGRVEKIEPVKPVNPVGKN